MQIVGFLVQRIISNKRFIIYSNIAYLIWTLFLCSLNWPDRLSLGVRIDKGLNHPRSKSKEVLFVCLFELMFCVPVNSKDHVGTLPPFYGTFTQH